MLLTKEQRAYREGLLLESQTQAKLKQFRPAYELIRKVGEFDARIGFHSWDLSESILERLYQQGRGRYKGDSEGTPLRKETSGE